MKFKCPNCKQIFERDMRIKRFKEAFKNNKFESLCDKGNVVVKCKRVI